MYKIKLSYNQNSVTFTNCEFSLSHGIYQLHGPNGSGKTTLLNILSRKISCDDLSMSYNDKNLMTLTEAELTKQYITFVPQKDSLLWHLRPLENIKILAPNFNVQKLHEYSHALHMDEIVNSQKPCNKLSGGEARKLSFIIGLLHNTPILLLDEVDNYVDMSSKTKMLEILKKEDRLIIIISHENLDAALKINISNEMRYIENEIPNNSPETNSWSNIFKLKFPLKYKFVFALFILAFTIMSYGLYQSISLIDGSIFAISDYKTEYTSTTSLIIYPPQINSFFDFYGNDEWLDTTPTLFTDLDFTKLKSLDGVKQVIPLDDPEMGYLCYYQNGTCYSVVDDGTSSLYSNIGFPQDVISNINITPYSLNSGEFPLDDSNQIAISTDYANENNLEVGDTVSLAMESEVDTREIDFEVSGTYNDFSKSTPVLFAYSADILKERPANDFDYFQQYDGNGLYNPQELSNLFEASNNFYYGFYIETDSPESLKSVSKQINSHDVYIENNSAVAEDFNFLRQIKLQKVTKQIKTSIIFVFTMLILILWILNTNYHILNKTVLVPLKQYGYSQMEIKKIIKNRTITTTFIITIIFSIFIMFQQINILSKGLFIIVLLCLILVVKIFDTIIKGQYENKN